MAEHQGVEEAPQRRQVQFLGRHRAGHLVEVAAHLAGRQAGQLVPLRSAQARKRWTAWL